MSGQVWLTDQQVKRLRPYFPKPRDKPRVDDRRVLNGIRRCCVTRAEAEGAPFPFGSGDARDLSPAQG